MLIQIINSPLLSTLIILIAGFFVQKYFVKRANESELVDAVLKHLDEIRNDTLSYWTSASPDKEKEIKTNLFAQRIKANLRIVSTMTEIYTKQYFPKRKQELENLVYNLFKSITSKRFECIGMETEPAIYFEVTNTTNKIRALFLKRKI